MTRTRGSLVAGLAFLVLAPLAAHLAFSPIGFNPTDDGFILGYSRRILEGEVPHRDFVSIRPVGSALLHAPVVAFGGDHTFLLSRLVVLVELALLSWAWVLILHRLGVPGLTPWRRVAVALVVFAFTLHTFPIMAWHTIDGLLFVSLGFATVLDPRPRVKLVGYALVGAAALFKQNYFLALPGALVATGDWRRPAAWAAGLVPGAAYGLTLVATGALRDGLLQMGSLSGELFSVGVSRYLETSWMPWGLLVGGVALALAVAARPGARWQVPVPEKWRLPLGAGAFLMLLLAAAAMLPSDRFVRVGAFALFGATLAVLAWAHLTGRTPLARAALLALLAAWTASLSFGYNSPALGAGALVAVLLATAATLGERVARPRARDAVLLGLTLVVVASLAAGRVSHVYREPPASQLGHTLDDQVSPGIEGIRTSEATYDFLTDLDAAIEKADGRYAILPDAPAHWVQAEQRNPLPIDWPLDLELNKPELVERVTDTLDAQRGSLTAIVQKIDAGSLAEGPRPLQPGENQVVDHVRVSWEKVGETEYFDLYR